MTRAGYIEVTLQIPNVTPSNIHVRAQFAAAGEQEEKDSMVVISFCIVIITDYTAQAPYCLCILEFTYS